MAQDHLLKGENPADCLHLSFDIDAADPFLAPSTGTRVRGGLSFREVKLLCVCECVCKYV